MKMNSNQKIIAAIIIIVLGAAVWYALAGSQSPAGGSMSDVACPQDAKICPDGSAVGRVGPDCEFAACPMVEEKPTTSTPKPTPKPTTPTTPSPTSPVPQGDEGPLQTGYYHAVTGFGVTITPQEVVEDSRCPSDAQCVWAGTIKVKTLIQTSEGTTGGILALGEPFDAGTKTVTLTNVTPAPKVNTPIGSNQYVFTYEVKKK